MPPIGINVPIRVVRTPIRSPKANAVAERFVGTIRLKCLDHVLVFCERHLEQLLKKCVRHYNEERPHRGLSLRTPEPKLIPQHPGGEVVRTTRLGGLINEYHREAALTE